MFVEVHEPLGLIPLFWRSPLTLAILELFV